MANHGKYTLDRFVSDEDENGVRRRRKKGKDSDEESLYEYVSSFIKKFLILNNNTIKALIWNDDKYYIIRVWLMRFSE